MLGTRSRVEKNEQPWQSMHGEHPGPYIVLTLLLSFLWRFTERW